MQLFYSKLLTPHTTEFIFDKDESRHISKVLRKTIDDSIDLTDGNGYFYKGKIVSDNPKKCVVAITSSAFQNPLPYTLHMAVAPTKLNDRFEWFLEKATEIGVTTITPIICDHSERKVIKKERYEKIIQSAAKQSLKAYFPILEDATSFSEFIETTKNNPATKCIAHCENLPKTALKNVQMEQSVILLIGPEGDFSTSEIKYATQQGYTGVSLGTSRLRTETAAIVACSTVALFIKPIV